jgi:hypothetical protein
MTAHDPVTFPLWHNLTERRAAHHRTYLPYKRSINVRSLSGAPAATKDLELPQD